jgi:hypothetical protein
MTAPKIAEPPTATIPRRPPRAIQVTVGALGLVLVAVFLGFMVSRGYGLEILALLILGCVWISPIANRAVLPFILLGVVLVPTPAIGSARLDDIPLATTLGVVTLLASVLLWWHRRAQGARLNPYAVASLLLVLVAAILQLVVSSYADVSLVYQVALFWVAGLLLGSVIASDRRVTDNVGLLALPLALLAVVELVLKRPNLWGDVVNAHVYGAIATAGGNLRATSTFGHPLVAGAALIVLAFIAFTRAGRWRTLLFSIIVVGAVATVSRSALVGLGVGLLVYFLGSRHERTQIVGAVLALVAMVWVVVRWIPALRTSLDARLAGTSAHTEGSRLNALHALATSLTHGETVLLTGRGIGGSQVYLARIGGNLGVNTYDNQYVTSLFDSGILVVAAVVVLIVLGIRRTRPDLRVIAPLAASAATLFFYEGLYWPVTGLLFWLTVGLATSPGASEGSVTQVESSSNADEAPAATGRRRGSMSSAPA